MKYGKTCVFIRKLNIFKYASAHKLGTQHNIAIGNMKITIAFQYRNYKYIN